MSGLRCTRTGQEYTVEGDVIAPSGWHPSKGRAYLDYDEVYEDCSCCGTSVLIDEPCPHCTER